MKEEALKLADESLNSEGLGYDEAWNLCIKQARMIRRLVEELDKQDEPIAWATEDLEEIMSPKIRQAHIDHPQSCAHKFFPIALYATPQTKPLSDEEMKELINNFPIIFSPQDLLSFARAIEERHGIK